MAAYAIASVKQKIEHLLSNSNIHLPIQELNCLRNDLLDLELVICNQRRENLIASDLEQEIVDAVDKIEDLIGSKFSCSEDVVKVIQEITCLKDKLKKGEYKIVVDPPPLVLPSPDDELLFGRYDSILGSSPDPVGLKTETMGVQHLVMRGSAKLKAIVVYGMAGCGKTTLVERVYLESLRNFKIRAMVTLALNFTLRQVLICLLTALGFYFDEEIWERLGESKLGMCLMKYLQGKRFLCVLDNLWDSSIWDQLSKFFPDEFKGSRIICTTRNALIIPSGNSISYEFYHKHLLNDDDSWELLRDVTSPIEKFSNSKLEEIGKEIAKKCEGLPLAIISIGKLLRETERTIEKWEKVLEDDDPFQIKRHDGRPISKSLYLSFDPLPYHLKLCFLYMGVLPEHYHIKPAQLFVLWIAEGLIAPKEDKSFEDTSKEYSLELRSKSMVLRDRKMSDHEKMIKTSKVHVVFRSLCIEEAQNEKFCLVIKKYAKLFEEGTNLQRLCIHNNTMFGFKEVHEIMESMSCVSSVLYCGPRHRYPLQVYLNFKDLKTLHAISIRFYEFPCEVLELFRLRYLAITYDGQVPSSIAKLWKLEFLILERYHLVKSSRAPSYLPKEIWNLQWLKHIQCVGFDLLDPNAKDTPQSLSELLGLSSRLDPNAKDTLQSLSELLGVSSRSCTQKILARMRNLKKLVVHLESVMDEHESFDFFRPIARNLLCLDSFKCYVLPVFNINVVPPTPIFPTAITRLTLSGCGFPWKYMSTISVLPNLKKLKLQEYAFCGSVWEACDGGFRKLQFFSMEDLNIEEWRLEPKQFPTLLRIKIQHCYNLREIPAEVEYVPTLYWMDLHNNSPSLEQSARQIQLRRRLELRISKLGSSNGYVALPHDAGILLSTKFE